MATIIKFSQVCPRVDLASFAAYNKASETVKDYVTLLPETRELGGKTLYRIMGVEGWYLPDDCVPLGFQGKPCVR